MPLCDANGCINLGGNVRRRVEALTVKGVNRTIKAEESGMIYTVGVETAALTLPTVAEAGNGWFMEFWVNDETSATVITAPGTDLIIGHVVTGADNNNRQLKPSSNIQTETVTLTTSAKAGDWVKLFCDGTNYFISGDSRVNNGITCAAE